jgi:membrane-bound lytic murein transglycosylase F
MRLKTNRVSRFLLISSFAVSAIFINGCDSLYWGEKASREKVQSRGELVVLTTQDPLTYTPSKSHEPYGIDHDLLEDFSASHNLKLRYRVYKNEHEVIAALQRGEGDIAAARLRPPPTDETFLSGPAYEDTHLSLFCRHKLQISELKDLSGLKIAIRRQDNFQDFATRFASKAPHMEVKVLEKAHVAEMLRFVQDKDFDCAIAEEVSGRLAARYIPQVEHSMDLDESYSLNWLLASDNQDLKILMLSWFQQASRNDEVMRIMDRYQTYLTELDRHDLRSFRRNLFETLPQYRQVFSKAAKLYNLPWQLIASVAYQESHWNAEARSFTGVRGLMQLTTETALHLGVEDRRDPVQSIEGGSKYLRYLLDKTPASLDSRDRVALALAAYNIGYAHLRDAQKLAERMGRNPYSWRHLRIILPLLEEPRYADQLEYGMARGQETVAFVDRVKSFYNYMVVTN